MFSYGYIRNVLVKSPGTDYAFINELMGIFAAKMVALDPHWTITSTAISNPAVIGVVEMIKSGTDHKFTITGVAANYNSLKFNLYNVAGTAILKTATFAIDGSGGFAYLYFRDGTEPRRAAMFCPSAFGPVTSNFYQIFASFTIGEAMVMCSPQSDSTTEQAHYVNGSDTAVTTLEVLNSTLPLSGQTILMPCFVSGSTIYSSTADGVFSVSGRYDFCGNYFKYNGDYYVSFAFNRYSGTSVCMQVMKITA